MIGSWSGDVCTHCFITVGLMMRFLKEEEIIARCVQRIRIGKSPHVLNSSRSADTCGRKDSGKKQEY